MSSHRDPSAGDDVGPATPLSYRAEMALSEAASLEELAVTRESILKNAKVNLGPDGESHFALRLREREQQLRDSDVQRTSNALSVAPFSATRTAAPELVEEGPRTLPGLSGVDRKRRTEGDGDSDAITTLLPFNTQEWARYFDSMGDILEPHGAHLRAHATRVARAIEVATALDPSAAEQQLAGEQSSSPVRSASAAAEAAPAMQRQVGAPPTPVESSDHRAHVAFVGTRGVLRGALVQAITGASDVLLAEVVGPKVMPFVLRHDDAARTTGPSMSVRHVRRVWLPLRAELAKEGPACPVNEVLLRSPELVEAHTSLGNVHAWEKRSKPVAGVELLGLVTYAHAALRCLAAVGKADGFLQRTLWPDGHRSFDANRVGTSRGPPSLVVSFPSLRGSDLMLSVVDVPFPDKDIDFLPLTVSSILRQSITAVVSVAATTRCPAQAAGGSAPTSGTAENALWGILRTHVMERAYAALRNVRGRAPWDVNGPPPLLVAATSVSGDRSSPAQIATAAHIRLQRLHDLRVPIAHIYAVDPIAGGSVVQVHDALAEAVEACSTAVSSAAASQPPGSALMPVNPPSADAILARLSTTSLADHWRTSHRYGQEVEGVPNPSSPSTLLELTEANELVWRVSQLGFLAGALIRHVVADHHAVEGVQLLESVVDAAAGFAACCNDTLVAERSFGPAGTASSEELRYVDALRLAMAPLTGLLKQQTTALDETLRQWDSVQPPDAEVGTPTGRAGGVRGDSGGGNSTTAPFPVPDSVTEFVGDAQKKVQATRMQLANAIRAKAAAVTGFRRAGAAAGSSSSTSQHNGSATNLNASSSSRGGGADSPSPNAPPPSTVAESTRDVFAPSGVAAAAVDAIAKRAASALQGTTTDVAVVSEALRRWWFTLPDATRIGPPESDDVTFQAAGDEAVLRLSFGIPELSAEFADNPRIVGRTEVMQAAAALQAVGRSQGLKIVLGSPVTQRVDRTMEWGVVVPPEPTAPVECRVTPHGSLPVDTQQPKPLLLSVKGVAAQSHSTLRRSLYHARRFAGESFAAATGYETAMGSVAAASVVARAQAHGLTLLTATSATNDSDPDAPQQSPLVCVATAVHQLLAVVHASLCRVHALLSASTVRPDDAIAHLAMGSIDEAPTMLYQVAQLFEPHAEWRRWRVSYHLEASEAAQAVANTMLGSIFLREPPEAWRMPSCVAVVVSGKARLFDDGASSTPPPQDRSITPNASGSSSKSAPRKGRALWNKATLTLSATGALANAPRLRPAPHLQQNRKKSVLCLCGGGVRGVLSALFVKRIDAIIQSKFSVQGRRRVRLWDCVDEVYGTSTGAIVAALLCIGVEPAAIVTLYREAAKDIFPMSAFNAVTAAAKPKYDPRGRLAVARRYMGRRVMDDATVYTGIARPRILVTDLSTLKTRTLTDNHHVPFVDALMAATAAPTFFPAHNIAGTYYCDGGIAENNPGLEVVKDHPNVGYVATIGTGLQNTNYQHMHNAGLLHWGPCFADVFIDSTQVAANDVLTAVFGDRSDYINVTLPAGRKLALDDATTLPMLEEVAVRYMDENAELFEKVAEGLYGAAIGAPVPLEKRGAVST